LSPVRLLATCNVTRYTRFMILGFKHKGLERFFKTGSKSGIKPDQAERLRLILARLNVSTAPGDMDLPGLYLHPLTRKRAGAWSVRVSGNWRVTFKFSGIHAEVVDYEDYH